VDATVAVKVDAVAVTAAAMASVALNGALNGAASVVASAPAQTAVIAMPSVMAAATSVRKKRAQKPKRSALNEPSVASAAAIAAQIVPTASQKVAKFAPSAPTVASAQKAAAAHALSGVSVATELSAMRKSVQRHRWLPPPSTTTLQR
jgi:hypothetical protein